jgi:hypothetical protein
MNQTAPQSKRKKEMQELLNKKGGFSYHKVKEVMNEVIVEMRLVPENEAKHIKTLYPKEVEEVLYRFR